MSHPYHNCAQLQITDTTVHIQTLSTNPMQVTAQPSRLTLLRNACSQASEKLLAYALTDRCWHRKNDKCQETPKRYNSVLKVHGLTSYSYNTQCTHQQLDDVGRAARQPTNKCTPWIGASPCMHTFFWLVYSTGASHFCYNNT